MSVWMSVRNLVILGQTSLDICEPLSLSDGRRTTTTDAGHHIMQKRHSAFCVTRSLPIGWARQTRRVTEIQPKAVRGSIFGRFISNFDKCKPEVAGDVIAGVSID